MAPGRIADFAQGVRALAGAHVEADRLLAPVVAVEGGVVRQVLLAGSLGGEVGADGVSARRFDLYDLRAPVREDAAGPRGSKICSVFNDFDALEQQCGLPILCAGSAVFRPAVNMC